MTDAELNERTLKLLGWRWEPLPGKNAGGNLYQPSGSRYHWYVNEVDAWSKAPQVATKWCEAGKMLSGYEGYAHHYNAPNKHRIILVTRELSDGIERVRRFKGTADTFPRAACLALCSTLENSTEKVSDAE